MAERPDHYIEKCKHGTVTGQCRCASKTKHEVLGECLPSCPSDIDEAAAVVTAECWLGAKHAKLANLARTALAWKARAEADRAEIAALKARRATDAAEIRTLRNAGVYQSEEIDRLKAEVAALTEAAGEAKAEPKKPETCKWTPKYYRSYVTGCGVLRGVLEGNYCPDCGKPVEVVNG